MVDGTSQSFWKRWENFQHHYPEPIPSNRKHNLSLCKGSIVLNVSIAQRSKKEFCLGATTQKSIFSIYGYLTMFSVAQTSTAQISQKSSSHLRILGARRTTWRKDLHWEPTNIRRYGTKFSRPEFVHSWLRLWRQTTRWLRTTWKEAAVA
jgi:hypothetical protein